MQRPSLLRVIQWLIAIGLFILIGVTWRLNVFGQIVINFTAALMFLMGIDNILIYYRCYKQKSTFENEGTFVIFCLFMMGFIFENFNKSYGSNLLINQICKYSIVTVLVLNFSYYAFVIVILIAYLFRQIYRLMTQTLLSANTQINRQNLEQFFRQNRQNFHRIQTSVPSVNNSCSICLIQFENNDQCILLPSCQHCFHQDCINQWLNTKSTCPYCRHNIQLDIMLGNQDD